MTPRNVPYNPVCLVAVKLLYIWRYFLVCCGSRAPFINGLFTKVSYSVSRFEEASQWRRFWFLVRAELVSSWLGVDEEELGMCCEGKRSSGGVKQTGGEVQKRNCEEKLIWKEIKRRKLMGLHALWKKNAEFFHVDLCSSFFGKTLKGFMGFRLSRKSTHKAPVWVSMILCLHCASPAYLEVLLITGEMHEYQGKQKI